MKRILFVFLLVAMVATLSAQVPMVFAGLGTAWVYRNGGLSARRLNIEMGIQS